MLLEGTVLGLKQDASPDWNFVSVVQDGMGKSVPKCDVVFPKDCELPKIGEAVSLLVNVDARSHEYRGKTYPQLSCFLHVPKVKAGV